MLLFCSREGSKTTIFGKTKKKLGVIELLQFFRISMRFLFNLDSQFLENYATPDSVVCFLFLLYMNGDYKSLYWVKNKNICRKLSRFFKLRCFENICKSGIIAKPL